MVTAKVKSEAERLKAEVQAQKSVTKKLACLRSIKKSGRYDGQPAVAAAVDVAIAIVEDGLATVYSPSSRFYRKMAAANGEPTARSFKTEEGESDDPERWLWVHCEGSHEGYRDMERFIGTVDDPHRADLLEVAIGGRGPFRRFRDVLSRWPDEVGRWHLFSDERRRGRARVWLVAAGYTPVPSPTPPSGARSPRQGM